MDSLTGSEAAFQAAVEAHRNQRWQDAEQRYLQIIEQWPAHVPALDSYGILLAQTGRITDAVDYFQRAANADSQNPIAKLHLADALKDCGRTEEAIPIYQEVVLLQPNFGGAAFNLANCLKRLGRLPEAIEAYKKCVQIDGTSVDAITNLGLTYLDAHDPAAALPYLHRALKINPNEPAALFGLGSAFIALGRGKEAERPLAHLVQLHREDHESIFLLAKTRKSLGLIAETLTGLTEAIGLAPENAVYLFERGTLLQGQKRNNEALADYERAKSLAPREASIYANIATIQAEAGFTKEAEAALKEGLALAEPRDLLRVRLALLLPVIYDSNEQIADARIKLEQALSEISRDSLQIADPVSQIGAPSFFLTYQGENDRMLAIQTADFFAQAVPGLVMTASHCEAPKEPAADRRLRLGVMSSHFREHTVARVNEGIIRNLSRNLFEVIVIRPAGYEDDVTRSIDRSADSVVLIPFDLDAARDSIARLELDVLFYPDIGMEGLSYFLAYSRLAPVQCVGWGHPDTTGIKNLDYYLSSKTFEPPNGQDCYSERLIELGRIYNCFYPPSGASEPMLRSEVGVPEGPTLYLCPQSPFKLHPDFDPVLEKLLARDPNGLVLLASGSEPNWNELLIQRFARSIPGFAERIQFVSRVDPNRFVALLKMANAIIDPIHFTGGHTSYLAFAAGLPVVTWNGRFLRGRLTAGLYRQMGIEGPIASSADEFVEFAFQIANEPSIRSELRETIATKSNLLFEDTESVEELGEFFIAAHTAAVRNERISWTSQLNAARS